MSSSHGKFIVIEGLEGAGKSTAVKTVMDSLSALSIEAITTREPGGTTIGEILRDIIKNTKYNEILDDRSELLLLYTARMQLVKQVIYPALQQGIWVIADRFELSTIAYQGGGRKLDLDLLHHLSAFCLNGFKPDLTLFLDITPEMGMQRAVLRGKCDRIEQQSIDFFHRVQETYYQHLKQQEEVVMIDAARPLEEVNLAIQKALTEWLEFLR
jgi:dTMP kinase